jgi:predicted nucleotidyltransferase
MQGFVKDMILRLADAHVEFVVVGGVSAVLQGAPITTADLDVCYRRTPENIAQLARVLAPLNPRMRGFPPDLPFVFDERSIQLGSNFTLEIGDESFDLLGVMSAIGGYEDVVGQALDLELDGHRVKVLSLEQLIATKTAAGRPKDLAVIPVLRATLELQQNQDKSDDAATPGP